MRKERFLGRQVIELDRIPLLGDFHPQDFFFLFFFFSPSSSGRRRPASISPSTPPFFLFLFFLVSRLVAWSLSSGRGFCCLHSLLISLMLPLSSLKKKTPGITFFVQLQNEGSRFHLCVCSCSRFALRVARHWQQLAPNPCHPLFFGVGLDFCLS